MHSCLLHRGPSPRLSPASLRRGVAGKSCDRRLELEGDEGRRAGGGGSEGGPASLAAARAPCGAPHTHAQTRARAREHTPPRSLLSPVRFPNQL